MARDEYEEEVDSDLLKEQLVAELDAARIDLRRAKTRVGHRLDVKTQAKRYVSDHRNALIAAAVPAIGLVLYMTFFKKKKNNVEFTKTSLAKTASGLVLGLIVKPYIRKWAMSKASDLITQRFNNDSSDKPMKNLRP